MRLPLRLPPRLIDEHSTEAYLRDSGRIAPDEPLRVTELTGGVSNMVLLVEPLERPGGQFVIKQSRAQLRTRQPWFSSMERIWREADVLTVCTRLLDSNKKTTGSTVLPACTPQICFEDRDNYLFAMTAAPQPNAVWKSQLLAGQVDPRIATACGQLLGNLHAESWRDENIKRQLGDRTLFDELRVDPYYRTLAQKQPDYAPQLNELIDSLERHPLSLVHADFSPKNLLVFEGGLMMVDFETGHYGDPAFDLGFFLSHLVLKACEKAPQHVPYLSLSESFWQSYSEVLAAKVSQQDLSDLWARGVQHFAGCAWARLDGKSPVDYLAAPQRREQMRALCREVFDSGVRQWHDVIAMAMQRFR